RTRAHRVYSLRMPLRRLAAALVAVQVMEGCSMMLTRSPPENDRPLEHHDDCSASYGAPVVDSTLALAFATGAVAMGVHHDDIHSVGMPATPAIIGVGIWAAVFGLSAGLGFRNAGACRDARARLQTEGAAVTNP